MAQKQTGSKAKRVDAELSLQERVRQLQAELHVLQRMVGESSVSQASLPDADFRVLCAELGDDLYGVRVDQVREIVRYVHLARVSDVPNSVIGAINVRGHVMAVVDARLRFGMSAVRPTLSTSVVLLELETAPVGLMVDRVTDVVVVKRGAVQDAEGPLARSRCLAGVTTADERLIQVLDLNRLLDLGEWQRVSRALSDLSELKPPTESSGSPTNGESP
jgi:purine-binding chemotaxis protein CheW